MYEIKKKNKFISADKLKSEYSGSSDLVKASDVPSSKKVNPGEFSAIANLKSLKKSGPNSVNKVKFDGIKGADKMEDSGEEYKTSSEYIERMKKRFKK